MLLKQRNLNCRSDVLAEDTVGQMQTPVSQKQRCLMQPSALLGSKKDVLDKAVTQSPLLGLGKRVKRTYNKAVVKLGKDTFNTVKISRITRKYFWVMQRNTEDLCSY